jgi:hypothetical protein
VWCGVGVIDGKALIVGEGVYVARIGSALIEPSESVTVDDDVVTVGGGAVRPGVF